MTLCRICGKEIPDGEELCQECQNAEQNLSDEYLDELMQSMENDLKEVGIEEEPVAETPILEEEPVAETPAPEEEPVVETPNMEEEPVVETPILEEEPVMETPILEEANVGEEETVSEEPSDGEADINELLSLLSQDYEDIEDIEDEPEPVEAVEEVTEQEKKDETPIEASLFSEEDDGNIFADDALSVDDIFDDALSAVDFSEAEQEEDSFEEFVSPEATGETEQNENALEGLMLDSLALDESGAIDLDEGNEESPILATAPKQEKKKKTKANDSIWKRVFGNIITEQTAEEEAKEREAERASEEEKAAAKEEKKKQAAALKAEKAEQAQAEKERKAAEKAEQAAVKAAAKEEKKRLKAEAMANEVVGKINPLGASIVMVFFGLLCVATIVGSQVLSHFSSVRGAEKSFEKRDYKEAYESLAGVKVDEDSDNFETKDKIRICMQLQHQLDAYENYYEMKMYLEALDSLMKGIRSYDMNRSKAERYDVVSQYNELEVKLAEQLYQEFGVSESQARSINSIEGQVEYTSRLETIIEQWEQRNKEDEK